MNKHEVTDLIQIQNSDLALVLTELNLIIPKNRQSKVFNQFHFDILILFKKIKQILSKKNFDGYLNVRTVGVLKRMIGENIINLSEQFISPDLNEELLNNIINEYFEG